MSPSWGRSVRLMRRDAPTVGQCIRARPACAGRARGTAEWNEDRYEGCRVTQPIASLSRLLSGNFTANGTTNVASLRDRCGFCRVGYLDHQVFEWLRRAGVARDRVQGVRRLVE